MTGRRWLTSVALVVVLGMPAVAFGQVLDVKIRPGEALVPFNRPATITVRWQVFTDQGVGTQVTSSGAVLGVPDPSGAPICPYFFSAFPPLLLHASTPFGLGGGAVSGVATTVVGSAAVATVTETIRIPAAWLVWARENGHARLDYIRVFDDGSGNTDCALVQIKLVSGGGFGGTEFGLSYVRMRFDDGSVARVVPRGGTLKVRAEVRYRGRGLLRAVWEVADPASTRGGKVVYVPLKTVHRYLTGAGRTVLEGPALPTTVTGLHLVRLRLIEPAIEAPNLFLRYFVRVDGREEARVASIALSSPAPGAGLRADTRFAWAAVAGAAAYRLEIYEAPAEGFAGPGERAEPSPDTMPVSGVLLGPDEHSAPLTALARQRLHAPAVYLWRVVAFDADGRLIAASPYRRLVVTGDGGAGGKGTGTGPGGG